MNQPQSHVLFYISGHGFGHASRDIELIRALLRLAPNTRISVRTRAPQWLFEAIPSCRIEFEPVEADTGVVQTDSFHVDETETARRAAEFYDDFDRRVAEETAIIRTRDVTLVVGDIPPLAFAAAAQAGVPSIAVGNFTWDWIYRGYAEFETHAPGVIDIISSAYARAGLALRLPIHGGFTSMVNVTRDIPFIARRSTRDRDQTRRLLAAVPDRPLVLASFGLYGADFAWHDIARSESLTVIAPPRHPTEGLEYQDLVAAADVVVSKPGYGIVSECVANHTPLMYTSRGNFVEYDVMVAEMPRVLRCRYIPQQDLLAGRWRDSVSALLKQPAPPEKPRVDGADVAARETMNLVMG